MINKIKIIIFSRLKKPKSESWVKDRREICNKCEFNTKNIENLSFKIKVIKLLSDAYSFLTGKKKIDNLGNCTACEICSIYFKTAEEVEQCPAEPVRWSRIIKE